MALEPLLTDARSAAGSLRDSPAFTCSVIGLLAGAVGFGTPVLGLFRLVSIWPPRLAAAVSMDTVPEPGWALPWSERAVPAALVQSQALAELLIVLGILGAAVVLIAAAGLIALLVERADARRQELAVHVAHGASRNRLARRLILEGVALTGAGLLIGLALARPVTALGKAMTPEALQLDAVAPGGPLSAPGVPLSAAVVAGLILLVTAGVLFPLLGANRLAGRRGAPSLAARTDPAAARGLLVDVILVGHVALTLAILSAAGLLARNAAPATGPAGLGFDPRDTLVIRLELPAVPGRETDRAAALEGVLAELAGLPGIRDVSAASPGSWAGLGTSDQAVADCGGCFQGGMFLPFLAAMPRRHAAGPRLFETMGASVRAGREFTAADVYGAERVALVNGAFAAQFRRGDPLGRPIWLSGITREPHTIIGVVGDFQARGIGTGGRVVPAVYLPVLQHPPRVLELLARTEDPGAASAVAISAAVELAVPGARIDGVETLEARMDAFAAPLGWFAGLFVVLAAVALALGAYGIYGAVRFDVGRRTAEIGVRRAVGARRWDVMLLVLHEAALRGLIGGGLGLYAALALGRALQLQFTDMRLLDPPVFGVAAAVITVAVLAACLPPARAAARQDPARALGSEHS